MKIYNKYIDKLIKYSKIPGEERFAAKQLLEMHNEAIKREEPIIVELELTKVKVQEFF